MTEDGPMKIVPFRLPVELIKRLDDHAERLRRQSPGLKATRADAVRILLNEALDRAETKRDSKRTEGKR